MGSDEIVNTSSEEPAYSKFEAQTIAQFDALVEKGEIFWSPTEEIRTEQDPFDVSRARNLERVQTIKHRRYSSSSSSSAHHVSDILPGFSYHSNKAVQSQLAIKETELPRR